ncbi:hypothetical protein B484DRAFT_411474, partial [Ochromonadaceae sp. CCMP2298]
IQATLRVLVALSDYPQFDTALALYDALVAQYTLAAASGLLLTQIRTYSDGSALGSITSLTVTDISAPFSIIGDPSSMPTSPPPTSSASDGVVLAVVLVMVASALLVCTLYLLAPYLYRLCTPLLYTPEEVQGYSFTSSSRSQDYPFTCNPNLHPTQHNPPKTPSTLGGGEEDVFVLHDINDLHDLHDLNMP